MIKFSLVPFLLFIFTQPVFSQLSCGTIETPAFIERLEANKRTINSSLRDGEITYLPINFINVGRDNGSGKISTTKIYRELCHINTVYAVNDVQFYLHENTINELDNQTVFENAVDNPSLLLNFKVASTINVFIVNNASSGNSLGVTLGYFWPGFDYIVMLKTQIGKNGNTLPHELGHYFSLPHTFRGWDHDPWNENDHGAIVGNFSPGGAANEKVNGSNCNTAGDLICDTPADYNLGFGYSGDCNNYQGNCHDPNGELLAPMEENYMGYFNTCDPETFTPMQADIILQDIQNRIGDGSLNEGGDLTNLYFDISDFNYLSPLQEATPEFYNDITFEWDEVDNATNYFIEIDRIPNFTFNPIATYQNDNNINVTSLTPGKKYYWRVWPLNKYMTCPISQSPSIFYTPEVTGVNNLQREELISISPNPVHRDGSINIKLKANYIEYVKFNGIDGRNIFSQKVPKNKLNFDIDISKYNLFPGIYYIDLIGINTQYSSKVIIE